MSRVSLAIVVFALATVACASQGASESATTYIAVVTEEAVATAPPTVSPTLPATKQPTSAALPRNTTAPVPTPTFFSEVLGSTPPAAVAQAPQPTQIPGGTVLPLPPDTTVVWGGCTSDGECNWFNFYWAPTHEVVMQDGESQIKVQHELCHAHQHWSINAGAPLDPSDYDLEPWYQTAEGQSYSSAVAGLPWPWSHSAVNGLEDFAWTCAYWYVQPDSLLKVSPERYAWAVANLP